MLTLVVEVDSWQSDSSQSFPNMGLDSIAIQLKRRKKAIIKAVLYLALLIAYIRVYLIEECLTYISGRTTLSSLTEKVKFICSTFLHIVQLFGAMASYK